MAPMICRRRVALAMLPLAMPALLPRKVYAARQERDANTQDRDAAVQYDVDQLVRELDAVERKLANMDTSISILTVEMTLLGFFMAFRSS